MKVWVGIDVAKDSLAVWIRPLPRCEVARSTTSALCH